MPTVVTPDTAVRPVSAQPRLAPRWNIVLHDDNEHTYSYVIEMLSRLFGHSTERAYELAREVDTVGRVVVATLVFEQAEFKQRQIHSFGRDWRLATSRGSMSATLEPAGSC
jgi:ATP-dependent Clp protease adaptor protein ClpS